MIGSAAGSGIDPMIKRMAGQRLMLGFDGTVLNPELKFLIEELKVEKIDGLVIDLRGNGGGFLPEAQSLTGLFVDQGPVVQVQFANGAKEVLDDIEQGTVYDGPLVVLIDRFSASASEIFAGAIQDYHRGLIVGALPPTARAASRSSLTSAQ